jgi:hypothetical protein
MQSRSTVKKGEAFQGDLGHFDFQSPYAEIALVYKAPDSVGV